MVIYINVFFCCRIAYIEFKTEADAEKTFEEKQGTEIDGRSVSLYYTGEKGQNQDYRGGKNSTWSGEQPLAGQEHSGLIGKVLGSQPLFSCSLCPLCICR